MLTKIAAPHRSKFKEDFNQILFHMYAWIREQAYMNCLRDNHLRSIPSRLSILRLQEHCVTIQVLIIIFISCLTISTHVSITVVS